ncbi:TasA family protein [Nocardioides sp.]|uniref:TasA family protein n=1 Tax=Nocardioides sp. TaxID=35761 RepID=UPI003565D676
MTDPAAPRRERLRSPRLRALLGLGLVAVLGTTGTYAAWTDNAVVSGTSISSGTIDLRVDNQDSVPAYTTLNLATMVPGNSTAGQLTIKNNGTAPLKYTATTTAGNADGKGLGAALVVKVSSGTVQGISPAATCSGSALAGTESTLGGNLVTTGRLLQPGATETLCIQLTLPLAAATSLQGATTNVTLTFTGSSDIS